MTAVQHGMTNPPQIDSRENSIPGKRVLIYYRCFDSTLGGGEYLPLSFIAELQKNSMVTLALDWKSDVEGYAKKIGIDIDFSNLDIVFIKPKKSLARKLDAIIPFYRTRQLKKLAKNADVCISTINAFDFGKPAHHFIFLFRNFGDRAFFDFCSHKIPPSGMIRIIRKSVSFLVEHILRRSLGVRSTRKILADPREHIYPNSQYAEKIMRMFYGPFNSTVFYPPTIFEPHGCATFRDPLKVIYIGRIDLEKHIDDIVDIVERTRMLSGKDISLEIAGRIIENYTVRLQNLIEEKPWISLRGQVFGEEKDAFLCSGTYAIHAMRKEAFGISVTEYLKAGCIPIVPDEGGTFEIVNSPELTFSTNDEAARILTRLITDESFRERQRHHCKGRAEFFSRKAFLERQHNLLEEIISADNSEKVKML